MGPMVNDFSCRFGVSETQERKALENGKPWKVPLWTGFRTLVLTFFMNFTKAVNRFAVLMDNQIHNILITRFTTYCACRRSISVPFAVRGASTDFLGDEN